MDKPAIISALEGDARMLDFAGMAMYKIREPKGSTRLSFEQISIGKQNRNRELAVQVISQVLQRYPDPQAVTSVDEVKEYMADVMYRTLAPTKAEHFPFDQRTPFAKNYYREKASAFFYDFLAPIAEYSKSELPTSISAQLGAGNTTSVPRGSIPKSSVRTKPIQEKKSALLDTGVSKKTTPAKPISRLESGVSGTKTSAKPISATQKPKPRTLASKPQTQQLPPAPTNTPPSESQTTLIGCLMVVVVALLLLLLVQTF